VVSVFGEANGVECFTENDIMKNLGLSLTSMGLLKEFIRPAHLKFICDMYGVKQQDLHSKINEIGETRNKTAHDNMVNENVGGDGTGNLSGGSIQSLSLPSS
jgi:hypothetical protein